MDRHYEDSYGRGSEPGWHRRWLRSGGVLALAASLWLSLSLQGSAQGWVLWCGVLTLAALIVVLALTYRPRHMATVAVACAAAAPLAALATRWLG